MFHVTAMATRMAREVFHYSTEEGVLCTAGGSVSLFDRGRSVLCTAGGMQRPQLPASGATEGRAPTDAKKNQEGRLILR